MPTKARKITREKDGRAARGFNYKVTCPKKGRGGNITSVTHCIDCPRFVGLDKTFVYCAEDD